MKEQQDLSHDNKLILEIIHKDANESLKIFRDDINSINTRLAIIIGFDASFVAFLSKIPSKSIFSLSGCTYMDRIGENCGTRHSEQIMKFFTELINYFLNIKPLIGLALIVSLIVGIMGLSPKPNRVVIFPAKMLERAESPNMTEDIFLKGIIDNRDTTISNLLCVIDEKAKMLNLALTFLGIAAVMAIITIISDTSVTKWG